EEDIAQYCEDDRTLMNNKNWPYTAQVALGYGASSSSNSMDFHTCSATLISDSTALTAAHCFWDADEGRMM
ncbi:MAG: trypsin-like serine protease, partial [Myxococcota bacterium]